MFYSVPFIPTRSLRNTLYRYIIIYIARRTELFANLFIPAASVKLGNFRKIKIKAITVFESV